MKRMEMMISTLKAKLPNQPAPMRLRGLVVWMILAGMSSGCQPGPVEKPHTSAVGNAAAPLPVNRPATADEAVASDPCANRLHDIEGALLLYYLKNKQLPDTLEQIRPYADFGIELNFSCPGSKLPYQYNRQGLTAAGQEKRLIVWDATPVHPSVNKGMTGGLRWGILMPRVAPGTAMIPEVVPLPENVFQAFVPPIQ